MSETKDPTAAKTPWRRVLARCSLICPFAALLLMCVITQVIGGDAVAEPTEEGEPAVAAQPAEEPDVITPAEATAYYVASWVAMGLMVAGILTGGGSVIDAARNRDWDTSILSGLGLLINGSLFAFCLRVIIAARG